EARPRAEDRARGAAAPDEVQRLLHGLRRDGGRVVQVHQRVAGPRGPDPQARAGQGRPVHEHRRKGGSRAREMAARVEARGGAAPPDLAAIEAASARQERRRRWQRVSTRTLSLLALFGAWWAVAAANATYFKWFNPVLLPAPPAIGKEAWRLLVLGTLQWDVLASLARVAQGFVLAAILGVVAGTLVARVRTIENVVEPVLDVLRPIPPLAFLPLLVLYLGIGEASKIGFIAYSAFFPIFTTTREDIKYVDPLLLRAAESLGATRRDILRYV